MTVVIVVSPLWPICVAVGFGEMRRQEDVLSIYSGVQET
jgi:hypothetical protein